MKRFMKLRLFFIATLGLFGFLTLTPLISAQSFDPLAQSCAEEPAKSGPVCKQKAAQLTKKTNPVVDTIHTATNILGIVAGVGAVIIIIYSGFVFVTAGGALSGSRSGDNPNRARQARSSLTGAVIGLIIVALSWAIITFFTNRLL